MNYIKIETENVENGEGLRVILWLSGCNHKCDGCQNPQTWNPNGGIEFDKEAQDELFRELSKDYISGLTISGGDPLHENNLDDVLALLKQIRISFGDMKTIWLYSGYTWDECHVPFDKISIIDWDNATPKFKSICDKRKEIISLCDVFVDGQFEKDKADMSYPYAGSTNQRVIDVKKSLEKGEVILW